MASLPKFPHRVSSPHYRPCCRQGAAEAGVVTRAAQDAVDAAHPDELVVAGSPQQVVIATEAGEGVVAWPADQDIVVLTVGGNEQGNLHAVADEDVVAVATQHPVVCRPHRR